MDEFVDELRLQFPDITFTPADTFKWSYMSREVFFISNTHQEQAFWSLLHEVGHALLEHRRYESDMQLLQMEVAAWQRGKELGKSYNIGISDDYSEDCLDTYRDWIYKRSTCPVCSLQGIQKASNRYVCLNCNETWVVTLERLCRPYRRSEIKKTP